MRKLSAGTGSGDAPILASAPRVIWGEPHYDPGDVDATNLRKNVEALAAKWKRRSRKKN